MVRVISRRLPMMTVSMLRIRRSASGPTGELPGSRDWAEKMDGADLGMRMRLGSGEARRVDRPQAGQGASWPAISSGNSMDWAQCWQVVLDMAGLGGWVGNRSGKGESESTAEVEEVSACKVVFLGVGQVFEHQRWRLRQEREATEVGGVIEGAGAGSDLA